MKLSEYIDSMSEAQQDSYASSCGTTGKYLRGHIKFATRVPRAGLMRALSLNSGGAVSAEEVFQHFGLLDASPSEHAA